jgi:hypothetical protein
MKARALRSLNLVLAFQTLWTLAVWLSELRFNDDVLLYLVQRVVPVRDCLRACETLGPKLRLRLRCQLKNALNGKTGDLRK